MKSIAAIMLLGVCLASAGGCTMHRFDAEVAKTASADGTVAAITDAAGDPVMEYQFTSLTFAADKSLASGKLDWAADHKSLELGGYNLTSEKVAEILAETAKLVASVKGISLTTSPDPPSD